MGTLQSKVRVEHGAGDRLSPVMDIMTKKTAGNPTPGHPPLLKLPYQPPPSSLIAPSWPTTPQRAPSSPLLPLPTLDDLHPPEGLHPTTSSTACEGDERTGQQALDRSRLLGSCETPPSSGERRRHDNNHRSRGRKTQTPATTVVGMDTGHETGGEEEGMAEGTRRAEDGDTQSSNSIRNHGNNWTD
ncbi:hypothetical protein D4764_14G0003750 [Takifugu flavidus]|uniref:Uncharacterized protein n=1 Tax=Takifugu flavidus TaxID=433684 RepID=A0A5C6P3H2_9TELE|nr:hypothetical protein D4764_14G0003750 [Takifugu flavidus]